MSTWNIYHQDGSLLTDANDEVIVVHDLEYSDSWMGECYVSITFEHNAPINFAIGDYLDYRGERFELNYDPGKVKAARKDSYGQAFKYDGVKFNAMQDELSRTEFLDVVLNDNELHYTALPKFSFYVERIDNLLDRIQANLNEQIGAGKWKVFSRNLSYSLQRGCTKEEWLSAYGSERIDDNEIDTKTITIDTQTCWEALALVNSEWDINFIVRGRNIYVGTAGVPTANIFKYGLGQGLYEIEQNADTEQSVTTRLRAYGSEKNLPAHYYSDLGCAVYATATEKTVTTSGLVVALDIDISWSIAYKVFTKEWTTLSETDNKAYKTKIKIGETEVIASANASASTAETAKGKTRLMVKTDYGNAASDVTSIYNASLSEKIYFTYGVNKSNWPSAKKDYSATEYLPNNMSVNRLMLPGFPSQSLQDYWDSLTDEEKTYCNPSGKEHKFSTDAHRPYIDSLNIDTLGLRSASQFFDTDDKTNGIVEIYPTIEEMVVGGVRVDEINEGVAPDDDGRYDDGQTVANVDIYLSPNVDFDITGLKDDDFSICMKDGMCGGRTFEVSATNKIDGRWRLTIQRVKDEALDLWFPYKDYPINAGDHFVLTGIQLPDSYVKAASLKLLKYAIAYLDNNDYTRYVYQPKADELFMARQHDAAMADTTGATKSLHDTLKAGDIMLFDDADLNIDAQISIDQLVIREQDGKIPTYDITLREDKEVGTIQKIKQQISSLESGNGGSGSGGGITATQVKNLVAAEGGKHFLSKLTDDTAKGRITFEKGIESKGDVEIGGNVHMTGTLDIDGGGMEVSEFAQFDDSVQIDGNLKVLGDTTTKNLTVTGQAHFFELIIDKIKAAGGTVIFSAANSFTVDKAVTSDDGGTIRLYWLAENGSKGSMNTWEVGDQAISMDFNRATVGTTYEASNKYWWALVTATSGNTPERITKDGATHQYHWIDISTTDKADGCTVVSEEGDAVAQWGSRSTDKKRQSAIMLAAYKSPDTGVEAPCFVEYTGINSFTIADANRKNKMAYDGTALKGSFTAVSETTGERDVSEWLNSLQETASAHFDIWYGEGAPTLENAPASSWATDGQKSDHVGDLYFDRTDTASSTGGHCYRFTATTKDDATTYAWEDYADQDTLKALTKAQSIADDGVITAGTEKAQLIIMRKNISTEFSSFPNPTDSSTTSYQTAYNMYKKAYDNFMTSTEDIVSEANLNTDTVLADIGLSAADYVNLYYGYYTTLAYLRFVNDSNIKASISTLNGKIDLSVTKDGLRTAGIDITDGKVVLDASKTTVTGDLTVQGSITDSTSYVWTDGTLWTPNDVGELEQSATNLLVASGNSLFVPVDMSTVKSVQIQTTDPSEITDGAPTTKAPGLVVLPMYDAVDLGCGATTPAYRRSGTHVLIRNAFSLGFTQWSKGADVWTGDNARRLNVAQSAVYICTDPRLLSLSNYASDTPTITADGRDVNGQFATSEWYKGCMYLNGRRGRWLVLLPGQEVELVSVITMWKTGTNAAVPYLAWYVVGGNGMDWLKKNLTIMPDGDGYTEYAATFESGITGGELIGVASTDKYADAFFGPKQMSDDYAAGLQSQTLQVVLSSTEKPYITIG